MDVRVGSIGTAQSASHSARMATPSSQSGQSGHTASPAHPYDLSSVSSAGYPRFDDGSQLAASRHSTNLGSTISALSQNQRPSSTPSRSTVSAHHPYDGSTTETSTGFITPQQAYDGSQITTSRENSATSSVTRHDPQILVGDQHRGSLLHGRSGTSGRSATNGRSGTGTTGHDPMSVIEPAYPVSSPELDQTLDHIDIGNTRPEVGNANLTFEQEENLDGGSLQRMHVARGEKHLPPHI